MSKSDPEEKLGVTFLHRGAVCKLTARDTYRRRRASSGHSFVEFKVSGFVFSLGVGSGCRRAIRKGSSASHSRIEVPCENEQ